MSIENDPKKIFSSNLRRIMEKSKIKQSDLVNDRSLNFSQSTVSDWMNGIKYPRPNSIKKLADYLNVYTFQLTEPYSQIDQLIDLFNEMDAQSVKKFRVLKSGPYSENPYLSLSHIVPAHLLNNYNNVSAVLLNDDSMNIYFPKNSYVFFSNDVPTSGDIVACILNKTLLVREYHDEKSRMLLSRSFTNQYDPIIIDKNDNFEILGKVIWYCASNLIGDE